MGEQVAALEKEIDALAERNAKLICTSLAGTVGAALG
jgi:hypothetical protein